MTQETRIVRYDKERRLLTTRGVKETEADFEVAEIKMHPKPMPKLSLRMAIVMMLLSILVGMILSFGRKPIYLLIPVIVPIAMSIWHLISTSQFPSFAWSKLMKCIPIEVALLLVSFKWVYYLVPTTMFGVYLTLWVLHHYYHRPIFLTYSPHLTAALRLEVFA